MADKNSLVINAAGATDLPEEDGRLRQDPGPPIGLGERDEREEDEEGKKGPHQLVFLTRDVAMVVCFRPKRQLSLGGSSLWSMGRSRSSSSSSSAPKASGEP